MTRWLDKLRLKVRSLIHRGQVDDELARELQFHLEQQVEENLAAGMPPDEARYAALRTVGNMTHLQEQCRDQRGVNWLDDARRDVAYAIRTLWKSPGFAAVAILTLSLGIGATTAIFSLTKAVLLDPLPYRDANGLVRIVENVPVSESRSGAAMRLPSMNEDEFDWWRTRTKTLSRMAVLITESRTMSTRDGTVRLPAARISPALFPMLGIQPVLGRWLRPDEERTDAGVVVLSTGTWRRYFGSDPNVIDRAVVLDGRPHAIVGVMPPEFDVPARDTGLWMPYAVEPRRPGFMAIVAVLSRLREGASIEAATAEANILGHQLRGFAPEPGAPPRFEVVRLRDQMVAPVKATVTILVIAVAVVLMIVCANTANLLLVRGAARQREIAIRLALGSGRARLFRQMLTESLVLSVMGGLAGTVLALAGVRLLKGLTSVQLPAIFSRIERVTGGILPRADQIAVDGTVLAFAVGLSMLTALAFGVGPALRTSQVDPRRAGIVGSVFNASGVTPSGGNRAGHVLAVLQLAMATALLVGAGLLLHSFVKLATVKSGFDPEGVAHFQLVLPQEQPLAYRLGSALELAARLQTLPQVQAVGFTNSPPLVNSSLFASVVPPDMSDQEFDQIPRRERPQLRTVSPGYLRAMGVRLLEGRWFNDNDGPGRFRVVLVNSAYVQRYLHGRNPIGVVLKQGIHPLEIVGVVDDIRMRSLDGVIEPAVFVDARQTLSTLGETQRGPGLETLIVGPSGAMSFAVRVSGSPGSIASDLQALVAQIDPAGAIEGLAPLDEIVSGTIARPRFYVVLMNAFGAIAGLLAAIGIYGVLAYSTSRRTQEFGIRLALGATPRQVQLLALRLGVVLVAVGIPTGLLLAAGLSNFLSGLLFELTPLDMQTYAVVAIGFGAVSLAASYVPAPRATRVDPLVALRYE